MARAKQPDYDVLIKLLLIGDSGAEGWRVMMGKAVCLPCVETHRNTQPLDPP